MAIPQHLVNEIMVKCGRHCCICRRFEPLHLQVHHIVEQNEGGTDDPDNLIVLCLTCHSDAHTETKLTRRFTVSELKMHREAVFKAVHEGRLPGPVREPSPSEVVAGVMTWFVQNPHAQTPTIPRLLPEAVDILLRAANGDGHVLLVHHSGGIGVQVGNEVIYDGGEQRKVALYKRAIEQLLGEGAISDMGGSMLEMTHDGYLLADALMAAGASCRK